MTQDYFLDVGKILSIQNRFLGQTKLDLPIENILSKLTDELDSLDDNHAVTVLLMSKEGLRPSAGNRIPKEWVKLIDPLPLGDNRGSCGTAGFFKKRVIVENILEDPLWVNYREYQPIHGFLSCWSEPIISEKSELLGTFAVYFKYPKKPNHQELGIIESLAISVRTILERRQYEQQLSETLKEAEAHSYQLELAMKRLNKAENIAHLGSWEWDVVKNDMFWTDEIYRIFGEEPQAFSATFDTFIEYIYPDDKTKVQQAVLEAKLKKQSCKIYHRIVTKDGAEKVVRKEANMNFDDSGDIVSMYGIIQDITVEKHYEETLQKLNKKLETLSFQDGLTSIANRRMFDKSLHREWGRSIRGQQPLSLILADIDYFKQYNDCYGHLAGDECLKIIAQKIARSTKRSTDMCARFGGEEFVILLPDTGLMQATKIAEECRENIYQLNIPHKCSSICDVITISIGVSSIIPNKQDLSSSLIRNADEALYLAKGSGRNRIETIC